MLYGYGPWSLIMYCNYSNCRAGKIKGHCAAGYLCMSGSSEFTPQGPHSNWSQCEWGMQCAGPCPAGGSLMSCSKTGQHTMIYFKVQDYKGVIYWPSIGYERFWLTILEFLCLMFCCYSTWSYRSEYRFSCVMIGSLCCLRILLPRRFREA